MKRIKIKNEANRMGMYFSFDNKHTHIVVICNQYSTCFNLSAHGIALASIEITVVVSDICRENCAVV